MELPNPRNQKINDIYSAGGSTWLNVNINNRLNNNDFNNWKKRQRGWMTKNGKWVSRIASQNLDFFCVQPGYLFF